MTEEVAPVSRRNEMGDLNTLITTQSSLSEMAEVGPRKPGLLHSSSART